MVNLAGIGGGTGLSVLLRGLKEFPESSGLGACAGNFTATTMGLALEFLGIAPSGTSMVPADATFRDHLVRHFDSWFTFLTDPTVPATNWEAEQAIRPAVVNRKVWGGNRTWVGARAQGVLLSVLETCRRQTRSTLDFVSQTLRSFQSRVVPTPLLLGTR